jgi:hypothetical protein
MNLIPTPKKHASDPLLTSRLQDPPPPKSARINPISPEKDPTLHSNSQAPQLNRHFQIQIDSKENIDTFDKVDRVRYPGVMKNASNLINKGDLHQKLPKITKKMMTRYNLMNNVYLPYQDNNMPVYDPTINYWEKEYGDQQQDFFKEYNRNTNRIIDAARGPDLITDPKFASARLHTTQGAYGGYDMDYPSKRKYRIHMPEIIQPKLEYHVPYQQTLRPFYNGDTGVRLVTYPSKNVRYWEPKKRKKRKNEKSWSKKKKKRDRKKGSRSKSKAKERSRSKKKRKNSKTV